MRSGAWPRAVSLTVSDGCAARPSDGGKSSVPWLGSAPETLASGPSAMPWTMPPNVPAELGRTNSARRVPVAFGAKRTSTVQAAPWASRAARRPVGPTHRSPISPCALHQPY